MPIIQTTVDCPIYDSFRVQQVAGLMDVPIQERAAQAFAVEVPDLAEDWQIGAIVGPSGSGKSTIAREAFGKDLYTGSKWPAKGSLIDGFPQSIPIKQITGMLTSVGFSQPPAWLKPYSVLSNGQKFRADLGRVLLGDGKPAAEMPRLVVFDEFTSLVDRTVAQVGSLAVAKTIRRSPQLRFVAVACHYDFLEWLAPDWVVDMNSQQLARGQLWQRPAIELEVHRSVPKIWPLFKPHHYLNASVPSACRYYVASLKSGEPVALAVVGNHFGRFTKYGDQVGKRTISRIVVLPDYQGIGIAGRLLDCVGALLTQERLQVTIRSGHPGMIQLLQRAKHWRIIQYLPHGFESKKVMTQGVSHALGGSLGRGVVSAMYLPPPAEK